MYINPLIEQLERKYPGGNREGILRLDMNENPGGLPLEVVESVKSKMTPEFFSTYPDKDPLINSLATFHGVSVDNIAITDGSEMALKYIFEAFGKPGSNFVSVFPTFEMYGVYANMYGLNHKKVDVTKDFDIDLNRLLECIDENTSIVSMLNPNNPVGRPYTDEEFRLVAEKTKATDSLLIIDEAYHYFYEGTQMPLLKEYDHIIVTRTFSKLFSIAACRIGYAVSSAKIVKMINNARPTFDTNSIALLFANELINNKELTQKLIATELEGREYLMAELDKAGYEYVFQGGNYVTIKAKTDAETVAERLLSEKKISIKTSGYDILKGYIRVTTGDVKYMKLFVEHLLELDK